MPPHLEILYSRQVAARPLFYVACLLRFRSCLTRNGTIIMRAHTHLNNNHAGFLHIYLLTYLLIKKSSPNTVSSQLTINSTHWLFQPHCLLLALLSQLTLYCWLLIPDWNNSYQQPNPRLKYYLSNLFGLFPCFACSCTCVFSFCCFYCWLTVYLRNGICDSKGELSSAPAIKSA